MIPIVHGFLAGLFTGGVGIVCFFMWLAERWELRGSPSCLRCNRELHPEDEQGRRSREELEELHVAGSLLCNAIRERSSPSTVIALVRAFDALEIMSIDRIHQCGGTRAKDIRELDVALDRMRAKLDSEEAGKALAVAAKVEERFLSRRG